MGALNVMLPLAEFRAGLLCASSVLWFIVARLFNVPYLVVIPVLTGLLWFARKTAAGRKCRVPPLKGKVAIVTGANTGIGKQTARLLAEKGAKVFLACRDQKKGAEALDYVAQAAKKCGFPGDSTQVVLMALDLSDLNSVRKFVQNFNEKKSPLHILINNAGVMVCPWGKTAQGFEMQFGTNHVGHFLLTTLLLENLKQNKGRIVNLSSWGHILAGGKRRLKSIEQLNTTQESAYDRKRSYGYSKLANIWFTTELQKRLGDSGANAYACHPGVVSTELYRSLPIIDKLLETRFIAGFVFKTPKGGAQTTLFCATHDRAVPGGYHADCRKSPTSSLAKDSEKARELWDWSEKLVADYKL